MIVNNVQHRYFLWKHAIRLVVINLERLDRAAPVESGGKTGCRRDIDCGPWIGSKYLSKRAFALACPRTQSTQSTQSNLVIRRRSLFCVLRTF